jgi:hypothetical protein
MFRTELEDLLRNKGLSNSSIALYCRNLEKLNNDMPLKNINFLGDIENIKEKLRNYKPNTRRGYYISITACLNALQPSIKKAGKLYKEYYRLMIDEAKKIKETPTDEMNDNQKENWISWVDVKNKYDELISKVDKFINNKEINEHQYNDLLSLMVLSLYYYNPPRRNQDYQIMNIVKIYSDVLPIDTNYLDYDGNEFIFNVFKTSKKEGQIKIKIDTDLKNIITKYLKFHPLIKGKKLAKTSNIPFLVYYDGSLLDKVNSITRILNKIFDKKIGSSMLRHIYLSDKYGDLLKEQKEDAIKMGHSVSMQRDYIKDDDDLE